MGLRKRAAALGYVCFVRSDVFHTLVGCNVCLMYASCGMHMRFTRRCSRRASGSHTAPQQRALPPTGMRVDG
eukprot:1447359-Prymnesium_polylepis.1